MNAGTDTTVGRPVISMNRATRKSMLATLAQGVIQEGGITSRATRAALQIIALDGLARPKSFAEYCELVAEGEDLENGIADWRVRYPEYNDESSALDTHAETIEEVSNKVIGRSPRP